MQARPSFFNRLEPSQRRIYETARHNREITALLFLMLMGTSIGYRAGDVPGELVGEALGAGVALIISYCRRCDEDSFTSLIERDANNIERLEDNQISMFRSTISSNALLGAIFLILAGGGLGYRFDGEEGISVGVGVGGALASLLICCRGLCANSLSPVVERVEAEIAAEQEVNENEDASNLEPGANPQPFLRSPGRNRLFFNAEQFDLNQSRLYGVLNNNREMLTLIAFMLAGAQLGAHIDGMNGANIGMGLGAGIAIILNCCRNVHVLPLPSVAVEEEAYEAPRPR